MKPILGSEARAAVDEIVGDCGRPYERPPTRYKDDRIAVARKAKAERFARALHAKGIDPFLCAGWSPEYWALWAADHDIPNPPHSEESALMICERLQELREQ